MFPKRSNKGVRITNLGSFEIPTVNWGHLHDSLILALVHNVCKLWAYRFELHCVSKIATQLAAVHIGRFPFLRAIRKMFVDWLLTTKHTENKEHQCHVSFARYSQVLLTAHSIYSVYPKLWFVKHMGYEE
jgi:hypothetical protein